MFFNSSKKNEFQKKNRIHKKENNKSASRFENKLYGMECVACGSCTYICPAKRPLMQLFKQTKAEIMAAKRAAQAAKK